MHNRTKFIVVVLWFLCSALGYASTCSTHPRCNCITYNNSTLRLFFSVSLSLSLADVGMYKLKEAPRMMENTSKWIFYKIKFARDWESTLLRLQHSLYSGRRILHPFPSSLFLYARQGALHVWRYDVSFKVKGEGSQTLWFSFFFLAWLRTMYLSRYMDAKDCFLVILW